MVKKVPNRAATLRLVHDDHGASVRKVMSTNNLYVFNSPKQFQSQKGDKLHMNILKNKMINPAGFDEVPLCWGNEKQKLKIPRAISQQAGKRAFSSTAMYKKFNKKNIYRPLTVDLLMVT